MLLRDRCFVVCPPESRYAQRTCFLLDPFCRHENLPARADFFNECLRMKADGRAVRQPRPQREERTGECKTSC